MQSLLSILNLIRFIEMARESCSRSCPKGEIAPSINYDAKKEALTRLLLTRVMAESANQRAGNSMTAMTSHSSMRSYFYDRGS